MGIPNLVRGALTDVQRLLRLSFYRGLANDSMNDQQQQQQQQQFIINFDTELTVVLPANSEN